MTWFQTSALWYSYLFIIGLIFFPLASKLFPRFVDRGYPFAKTIGIVVTTYVLFLLGILHLIPFSQESIFFTLILIALLFYKILKDQIIAIKQMTRRQWLLIIGEEVLFFGSLLLLIFIRGQEPSVHGLEKFMDYGFMQSINRSRYFPPLDMWLSADQMKPNGYPINYYYFGHLSGALLIKLSGVLPSIGYNFILATIFAQGMTLAYSLAANVVYLYQRYIKKNINALVVLLFGALGTFIINLAGNLHTIYIFTKGYPNDHPEPFWKIFQSFGSIMATMKSTDKDFVDAMITNSRYWYPNATRFIPFTIHEFPSYSYVVADLHGHVFDIPFVLLTLGIILTFFLTMTGVFTGTHHLNIKERISHLFQKKHPGILAPLMNRFHLSMVELLYAVGFGFMIAVHYMTNAFDGPIYMLFLFSLFFYLYRISLKFVFLSSVMVVSYILFSVPFSWFFKPFVSGIGVNCSPAFLTAMKKIGPFLFEQGNCQISPPWMMVVLWGFFWISAILLAITTYYGIRQRKNPAPFDILMLFIFAFGTFLIIIPEFFYIKDIYPAHFRANTMFKLGYQAFIMMGLASAYAFYRISQDEGQRKIILQVIYIVFFFLVCIYPFLAFPSYYPGIYEWKTYKRAPTIDGALWLAGQYKQDKEMIDYINANIPGQPVILEAQGDSYTDYNRISAYTGTPTIAGWWVHEWLWRGSADVVGSRIPDIQSIYESDDLKYTQYLLHKYHVSYVVVSQMEKDKYPKLQEKKFPKIGTKIFESSDKFGALYKVY